MKLFITGIDSFVASELINYFGDRGYLFSGSFFNQRLKTENAHLICNLYKYKLGDPIKWKIDLDTSVVIHCAHDFDSRAKTIQGTKEIFSLARESGVQKQIFLSSYSSRSDAVSEYGRVKYELEQFFLQNGERIVRPGLVVGRGGLYARSVQQVIKSPIIPLVDKGNDNIPLLWFEDLMRSLEVIINNNLNGEFNLFDDELISTKDFVFLIREGVGKRVMTFSISLESALMCVRFLNRLHIPFPLNETNLKSVKINQRKVHFSHLQELLGTYLHSEEMVRKSLNFFTH